MKNTNVQTRPQYIIEELSPECSDLSFYFDNDGLTEASGDYNNTLFIIENRRYSGFNTEEYEYQVSLATSLSNEILDRKEGYIEDSYEDIIENHSIPYSKKNEVIEWAENFSEETSDIAEFLTLKTGKEWGVIEVCGYCQGDWVEVLTCKERYEDGGRSYGEIWLGCAKEFAVFEINEDGEEVDSCCGYIVADSQIDWKNSDNEYKKLVCEWAGIPIEKTVLKMIEGSKTVIKYDYREV